MCVMPVVHGLPDLAYMGRHLAVFVHGCFWHGHACKAGAKVAKTNADDYSHQKISTEAVVSGWVCVNGSSKSES